MMSSIPHTTTQTLELISRLGVTKAYFPVHITIVSAISAGCLLSFAAATSLSVNTSPWFQQNAPGLIRMFGAAVFPYGLVLIVLTGAELCTGSFLYTTVACLHGRLSFARMLRHWALAFVGNLVGAVFMVAIVFGYAGIFEHEPYRSEAISFAQKKQLIPTFHQIFLRGIGCNWLVSLALFLSLQARDMVSKIVGIWLPVFAFVSLGLDHVIANMFFVPLAIFLGDKEVTIKLYIWKGVIPVGLGNVVGGALFVGVYYWFMYLRGEQGKGIEVDGVRWDDITDGTVVFSKKPEPPSDEENKQCA